MRADGKSLEVLVRNIEELFLPAGCSVEVRQKTYSESGAQLAEFDIVITGQFGTTELRWLIECRDRPSDGPAPGSWIEQLIARREIYRFNKVTAVSTTGFSDGARQLANERAIELRTLSDIGPEKVRNWLAADHMHFQTRVTNLLEANFIVGDDAPEEALVAAIRSLDEVKRRTPFLWSGAISGYMTLPEAFSGAVQSVVGIFDGPEPLDANGKEVRIHARYPDEKACFYIDSSAGRIRIESIHFRGQLFVKEELIPMSSLKEYRRGADGAAISQTVTFPITFKGERFALELHNRADTGETVIQLYPPPAA